MKALGKRPIRQESCIFAVNVVPIRLVDRFVDCSTTISMKAVVCPDSVRVLPFSARFAMVAAEAGRRHQGSFSIESQIRPQKSIGCC